MLWLVRHGESEGNAGLATFDYSAIRLTPRGQARAEAFATFLPVQPDRVIVSPYLRAKQTAEPTLRRFPTVPVLELPVQEFTYLHLAEGESLTRDQRLPLTDAYWKRMDPDYRDGPAVETFPT